MAGRSARRMSRKAGRSARRMSKKACLRKSRRATRKNGLKRGGLSKRVRRGGAGAFHQTFALRDAYGMPKMPKSVGAEYQPGNPDWQPRQPV